jgi:hypothetical protein
MPWLVGELDECTVQPRAARNDETRLRQKHKNLIDVNMSELENGRLHGSCMSRSKFLRQSGDLMGSGILVAGCNTVALGQLSFH